MAIEGGGHLQTIMFYFFVDEKTQGKSKEHRENTGNFILIKRGNPGLEIPFFFHLKFVENGTECCW